MKTLRLRRMRKRKAPQLVLLMLDLIEKNEVESVDNDDEGFNQLYEKIVQLKLKKECEE